MTINFSVTSLEASTIQKIVERAEIIAADLGTTINRMSLTMDLTACHANGTPLKLDELFGADRFNFVHDVWGVMRHIDRSTGKLTDRFLPRYAAPEAERAA